MNHFTKILGVLGIIAILGISGLTYYHFSQPTEKLKLATTTSVDNTGLLEALIERFTTGRNIKVEVLAKGTGEALRLAEDGEVDAVLVHAPNLELDFINNGYGINRTTLWYNYFLLVGPSSDPVNASNTASIGDSFQRIYDAADSTHPFVSRGDNSGTHVKENQIWQSMNISVDTSLAWYLESGKGMSSTLTTASQLEGYTLSDLGTYTNFKDSLDLIPIYQREDELLYNPYSFIAVNPEKFPVNYALAMEFRQFLIGSNSFVDAYRVNNEQLFIPIGTSSP